MDPVVILGTDVVSVGPGQEQRIPVRVRNQSRRVESYRVDVLGVPAQFAEVHPDHVSVLPGREAELDVVFRPPGGASTPTGTLPFAVRATSEVDASASAVAEGRLELLGVAGLQAWARETTRSGRWSTRFHLEFANQGNAAVRLALSAHDPTGTTRLKVDPDVVDLTAGGRVTATVEARSRQPFLRGSMVNRTIQAECRKFPFGTERPVPGGVPPVGDPNDRTFQLSFQQRPILPKFVLPLVALAVVAGLALAVVTLRKTTAVSLDLAAPLAPTQPGATPNGSTGMLLTWNPVPNAEGYQVRQESAAGRPAEQVLAEDLAADQRSYPVTDLLPQTAYCFRVRALGPGGHDSGLSEPMCATTPATEGLPKPHDVGVQPVGGDDYTVTWIYDGTPADDLEFNVLVTGQSPTRSPGPGTSALIKVARGADEQSVEIRVNATTRADESGFSDPVRLTIPALPPPTTASATTFSPPTTAATATSPATLPGGATTTTATTTTATTAPAPTTTVPSPAAAAALTNLPRTWVAMLGPVSPAAIGQLTEDQRKTRLATDFQVPSEDLEVFTNRDTIATDVNGRRAAGINDGDANARYVYFPTGADQATATEICGRAAGCTVLELVGAARSTEGTQVLIVEQLAADATLATLDAKLDTQRDAFVGHGVYALSGAEYPKLGTTRVLIFVDGFSDDADRTSFCSTNRPPSCVHADLGTKR